MSALTGFLARIYHCPKLGWTGPHITPDRPNVDD